jgi:hypothetical protein
MSKVTYGKLLDLKNCSVVTTNLQMRVQRLCILFFKNEIEGQMQAIVARFCDETMFFPWAPFYSNAYGDS